jgi:hypothetical protein
VQVAFQPPPGLVLGGDQALPGGPQVLDQPRVGQHQPGLGRHVGDQLSFASSPPWALLALGPAGLLLSASAFQAGALAASLPIMDTVEPTSGVLIGTLVFGEQLAAIPGRAVRDIPAGTTESQRTAAAYEDCAHTSS